MFRKVRATDKDVSVGAACLAATAIELGLVDELRMFLPPVTKHIPLTRSKHVT